MVNDNRKCILKKDLRRDLTTFNHQPKGGNDEVKLSKQEAIELCKLARGIKKILESKIAKA
ncbi:MAG TPA: hypothetical protein ACFYEK_06040 [Candidatus Wunengus sp. YC60]|uniref:hypothetical protein n=1 Tax=Candidatus Wunengus sp. YC60 TaxID=3367697 RepID=UPI0040268E3C